MLTEIHVQLAFHLFMTMNPLPPQAYTKDILQRAYTWLLSQSPSIKEMASSQDMLVSLYLKAQRNGEASLEAPSIQNFKQELKSLANMMGDFSASAQSTNSHSNSHSNTHNAALSNSNTHNTATQNNVYVQTNVQAAPPVAPVMPAQNNANTLSIASLDSQSLHAINEVRAAFNLSSDHEALRALIALGHKQFKKI